MDTKKRILIVDDEQINLEFFDVMLSKLGFGVFLSENGLEALEMVRRIKPDLIILDNIMPKLTGWEVTKILKTDPEYAEYAEIPIIMFSALDDVKDKVEGLELGADDYITKPFNFAEVLARIRAVLRAHDLIKQIEIREEHAHIGTLALEEIVQAIARTRSSFEAILNSADSRTTVEQLGKEALGKLDGLEQRIESLKSEAESIRKRATDLDAIRKRARAGTH
ncbi:MAG: response regulator transcription factor [Clostridia bacterium]|jgi:DNA-binding response OmpR family regulator|nr:response regulator [Spirochaetia bacterium]